MEIGRVHLAPEGIFENMLQLKRVGLHFERILYKNGYFHIEIITSAAHVLWGLGIHASGKILK